ncbi:AAA family ATPase [Streptomyces cyaneofuscatus]|uniref:AAA family ATPase n=1 Tax=Streptomyces cyaneofuscatus TaxID=66883 RepID=UPI0038688722
MTELVYPEMPKHSLVVLIGPSGAGKSTIARTWPASQVLSLDALRKTVSDEAGEQDATGDAVAAQTVDADAGDVPLRVGLRIRSGGVAGPPWTPLPARVREVMHVQLGAQAEAHHTSFCSGEEHRIPSD